MNVVVGFLILATVSLMNPVEFVPVVARVSQPADSVNVFQEGDQFYRINGHRIYNQISHGVFWGTVQDTGNTFVVLRDGERVTLSNVSRLPFPKTDEEGNPVLDGDGNVVTEKLFGIGMGSRRIDLNFAGAMYKGWYTTIDVVRLSWYTLGQIFTGQARIEDVGGPVMIGGIVNEIVSHPDPDIGLKDRFITIFTIFGFVSVSLAFMNLLPIPALDGGRILFLFISAFLLLVRKKPLSEKVEATIHGVAMVLLMGLMIFMLFKDSLQLGGVIGGGG